MSRGEVGERSGEEGEEGRRGGKEREPSRSALRHLLKGTRRGKGGGSTDQISSSWVSKSKP